MVLQNVNFLNFFSNPRKHRELEILEEKSRASPGSEMFTKPTEKLPSRTNADMSYFDGSIHKKWEEESGPPVNKGICQTLPSDPLE